MFDDFKAIIESQRQTKKPQGWEGTLMDYLTAVKETPAVAQFAPSRIFNMIMKYGTDEVSESLKISGYEDLVKYKFFDDKIFGSLESIHDIMRFLKASARRTETGRRILMMVGPVSSGKSTISMLLKRGLETDDTLRYCISGCPFREEPLHAIPQEDRADWEKALGVKISGHLCPVCQQTVDTDHTNEDGIVEWEKIPVVQTTFSEQRRQGIGTFQPSDPKSQDVSELIGRINMSKIAKYGETDARAYQFDGELQVANGGLIEYIEILKADVKFHYILLTLSQEQVIKSPGFPQTHIDTLILSHTNQTEFDSFRSEKKNEALHDRMYPIKVPWNLRVSDEVKIYEKLIAESDFANIHIAPHTLKVAAQFAVLSRLKDSAKVTNKIQKMKIYNGEVTDEFKKTEVDVRSLREEGRKNEEGMSGISPRFVINAINVALGQKEEKCCINPIDILRALINNFDHHIGVAEEDKERFITLLTGDKDSVSSEYKEVAKKEVNRSFLHAYDDQAQELFNRYMINVTAFCKKEKVKDSITGEYSDPDETIMRAIEELASVPVNSKSEFRNGVFVYKADCLENGKEFTYREYDPIREAIEKKLINDLKSVVSLSLGDATTTNPKAKKKRTKAFEKLMENGYCEHCANVLLAFVSEILRKEQ